MAAKKKKKWVKWVVIGAVAAVVVGTMYVSAQNAKSALYEEDTAAIRDIQTYHTFTGTAAPVDEQSVYATVSGVRVTKVNVEKGDTVKEGDVIAELDSSTVENQIAQSEATLDKTKEANEETVESAQDTLDNAKSNAATGLDSSVQSAKASLVSAQKAYDDAVANMKNNTNSSVLSAKANLDNAQKQYNDLVENINKNLDPNLQNAQYQMTTAYENLLSARNAYNDEVNLNNQQLSNTILTAQTNVDTAYSTLTSAQLGVTQAQESLETYDNSDILEKSDLTRLKYTQAVETAQQSLDAAWTSYNDAERAYDAAKINEESSLTSLYDKVLSAQDAYLHAVDSYNAEVNSLQQQLETYSNSVQQAQEAYDAALASQDQNIGTLKNSLDSAKSAYSAAVNAQSQQIESYENQLDQAKTNADTTTSELALDEQKDTLEDYKLTAPMDGEITALPIKEGDIISAGTAAATVTSFDKMKIDIKIGEYDIVGTEEGDKVEVTLDAIDGKTYEGTIVYIARTATVDNGVSYFEAEVDFDADEDVRSGMSAEVKLTINDLKDVLTVKAEAIQTSDDGTTYVQQYKDEKRKKGLVQVPVETGVSDGTYTEIKSGLSEGDVVCYISESAAMSVMQAVQEEAPGNGGTE